MKFTDKKTEAEFHEELEPECRGVALELEAYSLEMGFGELTLTDVVRSEDDSERIYLPIAHRILQRSSEGLPLNQREKAMLEQLNGLSREGIKQWARRRPSGHKRACAWDLRTKDKTPEQLEKLAEWLRKRCPQGAWELILETHGTGPHFHVSRKRPDWHARVRPTQPKPKEAV